MSFTNQTSHYGLPQYVGSDKPKYLTDFNQAMADIDAQMYENATDAATAQNAAEGAQSTADGAVSSIGTLNIQINGDPTDPTDTGIVGDISDVEGDVNTIQSLIGNGTPTTTDKTLIGAINELYSDIHGGGTDPVAASSVSYDNTTSGLTADDVQEALDEIAASIPAAGAVELQTGTLTAGQTSVVLTFAAQTISATSLIDVYVEDGLNYTAIATTSTTVTLTFESQAANKAVAVRVTN